MTIEDGKNGKDGIDGFSCTVSKTGNIATITCPDGTSASIADSDVNFDDNGFDKEFMCHVDDNGSESTKKLARPTIDTHLREHANDYEGKCTK